MSNQNNFFEQLDPKSALWVGLVGGVLTLGTIGFIVLGVMMLRGGGNAVAKANNPTVAYNDTGAAALAPEAPSDTVTGPVPPVTNADHVRGDKNAPVTIIEYSDYECPYCQRFHPTMQQVMEQYKGKVKWVYRHYPLSFHANAQKEAEAAECITELGGNNAFWAYTDAIFERSSVGGTGFPLQGLGPLAKELGVNQTKFQQCLDSGKYATKVQEQMAGGQQAGISGTPGSIVLAKDGSAKLISGAYPFEEVKSYIDAALGQ